MKIKTIITLLFLGSLTTLSAQSKLTVEIANLRNSKGNIALELLDKDNKTVKGVKGKIVDKKCTIIIKELKNAEYAIRVFHDEDSNDEIHMNFLGIPKEGVGISNDAFGNFGPKKFEEWLFTFSGDTNAKIDMKYILK
jgi:uncharacterized protein (DUF2141 family)